MKYREGNGFSLKGSFEMESVFYSKSGVCHKNAVMNWNSSIVMVIVDNMNLVPGFSSLFIYIVLDVYIAF